MEQIAEELSYLIKLYMYEHNMSFDQAYDQVFIDIFGDIDNL